MGEAKRRKMNDPSWGQGKHKHTNRGQEKQKHTNDRVFRVKVIEKDENDHTYLLEDQKLKDLHNTGDPRNPLEHLKQGLNKLESGELTVGAYLWAESANFTLHENQYYVVELSHHPRKALKYGIPTVESIIDYL